MIFESHPWKRELAHDADMIERWCGKPASERQGIILERKTFISAYTVRRLKESNKLTDDLVASAVPAIEYAKKQSPVTRFRHLDDIDDRYDLHVGRNCDLNLKSFVDTIIHSLYFNLAMSEDEQSVTGFYVTSDYRDKKLWFVGYSDFVKLLRSVSTNYPTHVEIWVDENGKEQRAQS